MDILSGKLDERGKFIIPEDQHHINIDVGLAGEAPHSAIWLSENDDRFVIGIEPLSYHWKMLKDFEKSKSIRPYPTNFKIIQLDEGVVKLNHKVVCEIGSRFCGIQCAIDDVKELSWERFYMMDPTDGASGSSSLLKPSEKHPHFIENIVQTPVISLEAILDHVDWERFSFIEHIKTDCEGKDYEAVRSIGKYLDRIAFITSELSEDNIDHWEEQSDGWDLYHLLLANGYKIFKVVGADVVFVNMKLLESFDKDTLDTLRCLIHHEVDLSAPAPAVIHPLLEERK